KWFFRWLLNAAVGLLVLFLLASFGPGFGLEIPLNPITVVVSALLGLPGVALILLKLLFL
ncbi:MAG: pro-sigmaK processing inhibitor BofA family protein, partial [Bacillota bacterium]|nr:pro-sigmaK processing inhibitor BofA family protein [Bacillota bacterium]